MKAHWLTHLFVVAVLMACDGSSSDDGSNDADGSPKETQTEMSSGSETEPGDARASATDELDRREESAVDSSGDPETPDDPKKDDARLDAGGSRSQSSVDASVVGNLDDAVEQAAEDPEEQAKDPQMSPPDEPTDCTVQTVTLARSGTTSSCGFDLPDVEIDTFLLNVVIMPRPGDRRVVCRVGGSGSCADSRGWFTSANAVALCDETCGQFNDYPEGVLVAEFGCSSSFCRDRCGEFEESCGPASDCCPGMTCEQSSGTCTACTATGNTCDAETERDCCTGHCEEGRCCYDLGGPCAHDDECCSGACNDAVCGCPAPEVQCNGACTDVLTDDANCGECELECAAGSSCVAGSCTCEQAGQTYCEDECVDTQSDARHCGGCGSDCAADHECVDGECRCPAGQEECGEQCVDLQTNSAHCGACGANCSSVEVCESGSCVCRPDRLLCEGQCIDPMSSNQHCGECNKQCNGQRRCSMGSCQ